MERAVRLDRNQRQSKTKKKDVREECNTPTEKCTA